MSEIIKVLLVVIQWQKDVIKVLMVEIIGDKDLTAEAVGDKLSILDVWAKTGDGTE